MFTVVVGFDASGKSRTRSPLGSEYSVIPSTDVTRVSGGSADDALRPARVPCAASEAGATGRARRRSAAAAQGDATRRAYDIGPLQVIRMGAAMLLIYSRGSRSQADETPRSAHERVLEAEVDEEVVAAAARADTDRPGEAGYDL